MTWPQILLLLDSAIANTPDTSPSNNEPGKQEPVFRDPMLAQMVKGGFISPSEANAVNKRIIDAEAKESVTNEGVE